MKVELKDLLKKRDGESNNAYQAFLFYYSLKPSERLSSELFAPKVAKYVGLSESTILSYSTDNEWSSRVSQIEGFLMLEEIKKTSVDRAKKVKEINDQYLRMKQKLAQAGEKMVDQALGLLDLAVLANKEVVSEEANVYLKESDGSFRPTVIPIKTTVVMESNVGTIPKLTTASLNIAKNLSQLNQEDYSNISTPTFVTDASNMSDEELEQAPFELAKLRQVIEQSSNLQMDYDTETVQ